MVDVQIPVGEKSVFGVDVALAYQQISNLTSAVGFTSVPARARYALVQCTGQSVRYREDGTNPTASVGMLLTVGQNYICNVSELSDVKFIQVASSAILNYTFYL